MGSILGGLVDNRTGKRASAATAAAGRERAKREPDGIVMISLFGRTMDGDGKKKKSVIAVWAVRKEWVGELPLSRSLSRIGLVLGVQ